MTPDPPRIDQRRSGVLLHVTSLPGPYGSGGLGTEAEEFAEFLHAAGQSWWQMLPVGPAGYGFSPYMGISAFALNPLLIDPASLRDWGLLSDADLDGGRLPSSSEADYDAAFRRRSALLEKASASFFRDADPASLEAFERYRSAEGGWLEDHALYSALREDVGGEVWTEWEPGLRDRVAAPLERARTRLAARVRHHAWVQYVADRQWRRLADRCRKLGIGLIGDLPIFVAHESADVWSRRDLFRLDEQGRPVAVAGVPPDYFSATGQRWGHPLYEWETLRATGYKWWIARFRRLLNLFDAVRIDHFIGFQRFWAIPAACPTAVDGHWEPGPSDHFFQTLLGELGDAPIIAEDLGAVGEDVIGLRDRFRFPGMRVLQFAFGGDHLLNDHLPHRYPFRTVVYTATHDNDTTRGWYDELRALAEGEDGEEARRVRAFLHRYLGSDGREIHWDMIRLALASVADLAIIPAQDLLGLGGAARMNRPARAEGNWTWRLTPGGLESRVARRLRDLTETYGRLPV